MPAPSAPHSTRPSRTDSEIPPGPNAGRAWHDLPASHPDPLTGRLVTRLTSYLGHSHHQVGRTPCWLDGGRRLVIVSDREGCANLFAYDFPTASLIQLTDLRGSERPANVCFSGKRKLAFGYGSALYEIELDSLCMRTARPGSRMPRTRSAALVGETIAPPHGRIVWRAENKTPGVRHVLAAIGGSGVAPHALAAPCLQPGGQRAIFVSDATGYAQIYAVDASAPATLPRLTPTRR